VAHSFLELVSPPVNDEHDAYSQEGDRLFLMKQAIVGLPGHMSIDEVLDYLDDLYGIREDELAPISAILDGLAIF